MSMDKTRLANAILAAMEADGMSDSASPKSFRGGEASAPRVLAEALAAGVVTEVEEHYSGSGSGTTTGFTYTQSAPALIWGPQGAGIPHTLGRRATVEVYDSAGNQYFATIKEPVVGNTIIQFAIPTSGSARLS